MATGQAPSNFPAPAVFRLIENDQEICLADRIAGEPTGPGLRGRIELAGEVELRL